MRMKCFWYVCTLAMFSVSKVLLSNLGKEAGIQFVTTQRKGWATAGTDWDGGEKAAVAECLVADCNFRPRGSFVLRRGLMLCVCPGCASHTCCPKPITDPGGDAWQKNALHLVNAVFLQPFGCSIFIKDFWKKTIKEIHIHFCQFPYYEDLCYVFYNEKYSKCHGLYGTGCTDFSLL